MITPSALCVSSEELITIAKKVRDTQTDPSSNFDITCVTNFVNSVYEHITMPVVDKVGDLSTLLTTDKTNAVNAINEVYSDLQSLNTNLIEKNIYFIELSKWNIFNNGTNPVETTNGINNALQWAYLQGYTAARLPSGRYLISKSSSINMVSNMTFIMASDTELHKEANAAYEYQVIYIPPKAQNIIIIGGSIIGDRDNHLFSFDTAFESGSIDSTGNLVIDTEKIRSSVTFDTTTNPEFWTRGVRFVKKAGITDTASLSIYWYDTGGMFIGSVDAAQWNTSYNIPAAAKRIRIVAGQSHADGAAAAALSGVYPTHEFGHCIHLKGVRNVLIHNLILSKATGDGIYIGAENNIIGSFTYASGAIDDTGKFIADASKCRTDAAIPLSSHMITSENRFQIVKNSFISVIKYDIYFYDINGNFLVKFTDQVFEYHVIPPPNAAFCYVVINQSSPEGAVSSLKSAITSDNIIISNCDLGYNRRQGISVVGGYYIDIRNNIIHDTQGTSPQSGIDLEGGSFPNRYINIKNNCFYNNRSYDVILYDGYDTTVDGNYFSSMGAVGFSSAYARSFTVTNNIFNKSKLLGNKNGQFTNNIMVDASASLYGPNIIIDGLMLFDCQINTFSEAPYGIVVRNATFINTGKQSYSIYDNKGHMIFENINIHGPNKLKSFRSSDISRNCLLNNVFVYDYNGQYDIDLPGGTYNNCVFEYGPSTAFYGTKYKDISLNRGKYVFNNCSFKPKNSGIAANSLTSDITFKNCTFTIDSDKQAIVLFKGAAFNVLGCLFELSNISTATKIIEIIPQNGSNNPSEVAKAMFVDNIITSNAGCAISTALAGTNAPGYIIAKNVLLGCTIESKPNDYLMYNITM